MSGGLVRYALAHLRGDWRRSLAAVLAITIAVASFVVLTGTVQAQQLRVTEQVASNFRSTYDLLVRPRGAAGAVERAEGVVRPNFLSGQYGGISLDQVEQISAVPGVEVAAPVAVLGQTMRSVLIPVNVRQVLGDREHALVRFRLEGSARNQTAQTVNQHGSLYLTRRPLASVDETGSASVPASPAQLERRGGRTVTACVASDAGGPPTTPATAFMETCWSARAPEGGASEPRVEVLLSLPLTVQAVDPAAEAQLTGLDQAMVEGRGLAPTDGVGTDTQGPAPIEAATAVMASHLPFDFQATLTVDELSEATADAVLATDDAAARRQVVLAATPVRTVQQVRRDAAETYRSDIAAAVDTSAAVADQSLMVLAITRPADVEYVSTNPLAPAVVPFDSSAWRAGPESGEFLPAPPSVADTGFRRVVVEPKTSQDNFVSFRIVGKYDPDRLPRPSRLNEVPLETYRPSYLEGADPASAAALGDKPMLSDLNPAGYVQSPPALLVSLEALPLFWNSFSGLDRQAPVSAVRVRVAGITGLDAVGRERIRQIADQIHSRTGLDVDITVGASLQNRQVALPATASGTPALLLNEQWTKKGVAVAVTQALDVKSLILFVLVLGSAALTVALIATASVQARRRELATLACLGWRPGRRSIMVGIELALLGLGAGTLGALVSWPLAAVFAITVPWWQMLLAVPLGALLALLPGLAATARAGRITPLEAFRPRGQRRGPSPVALRGAASLGVVLMAGRPARALLASLAVALAAASTVLLGSIVWAFNGAVVGSFLGDAVALQVRGPDLAAAAVLAVLGLIAVATVLLLALVEDAPAFAALQAVGWSQASLGRALLTQAVGIGVIGGVVGSGLAVAVTASVIGPVGPRVVVIAATVALAATGLSALAALAPALVIRRLPTARILARD